MQVDWELSQTLTSDGDGIRAVGAPPATGIIVISSGAGDTSSTTSTSMDTDDNNKTAAGEADAFSLVTGTQGGAIYSFGIPSGSISAIPKFQHDHSVTAVLVGRKVCVTGCKDGIIRLYKYATQEIVLLKGHEKPVTSLAWASLDNDADSTEDMEFIVSGSWDGTARVWKLDSATCIATLPGHENSVCVTFIPPPPSSAGSKYLTLATGSAGIAQNNAIRDHSVRLWKVDATQTYNNVELLKTVSNDHDGPIRDILCLTFGSSSTTDKNNAHYFQVLATCSNDGTVKLRAADTLQATSTLTFLQAQTDHPPMLLSMCFVQDGCLIASAEDGTVICWDLQYNNDEKSDAVVIATVGEPQVIRHATTVWQVRGLPNHSDFCTASDDGMLRIFTRSQDRMAPLEQRQAWQESVQQALDKQSSKAQGGPSAEEVAKLPHWHDNASKRGTSEGQVQLFQKDGIAIAAQWSMASSSWIEVGQVTGSRDTGTIDGVEYDHVLPIEIDNTQTASGDGAVGVATLQCGYNNGENPFTAAQRFIDAHMLPQHYLSQIADYIQQRLGQAASGAPTLGMAASSSSTTAGPTATTGVPITSYQHLPSKSMIAFELPSKSASTTLEKMKTKISDFGLLQADEMAQVEQLCATLVSGNSATNDQVTIITTMLQKFPPEQAFPALDLARIVALNAASAGSVEFWETVVSQAMALCTAAPTTAAAAGDNKGPAPAVAIPMLSLRMFCNLFVSASKDDSAAAAAPQQVVANHVVSMLQVARTHVKSSNKNIRLSVATLLHNVCYYVSLQKQSGNFPSSLTLVPEMMPIIGDILSSYYKLYEEAALMRTLQALGTWVMADSKGGDVKGAANALYLSAKVEMAASPHSMNAKATAKEVYSVLQ